ncbi:MAG TPA: alpha/beta fold hydrolase [Spirochaetes bacterium]|nr:alpha/beta fold hydrolase [Spirochaetota bacterium]
MKLKCKKILLYFILWVIASLNSVCYLEAYYLTHFSKPPSPDTNGSSWITKMNIRLFNIPLRKTGNHKTPWDYGLHYKKIMIPSSWNVENYVWEIPWNRDNLVLLFHGYSSKKENLLTMAKVFVKMGYSVALTDFPGHGDSNVLWTTLGYREAYVVRDLYNYYSKSYKNIILYGYSMGAASILRAVGDLGVQPAGIIAEMPYGSLYHTAVQRFSMAGSPFTSPLAELLVFWGGVQHGMNGFDLDSIRSAKAITVPTLVLGGSDDQKVPSDELKAIYKNLSCQKKLYIFRGLGHHHLYPFRPEEYLKILSQFMDTLKSQSFNSST